MRWQFRWAMARRQSGAQATTNPNNPQHPLRPYLITKSTDNPFNEPKAQPPNFNPRTQLAQYLIWGRKSSSVRATKNRYRESSIDLL